MGSSSSKKDKPKQKETDGNLQENKPIRRHQEQSHHQENELLGNLISFSEPSIS